MIIMMMPELLPTNGELVISLPPFLPLVSVICIANFTVRCNESLVLLSSASIVVVIEMARRIFRAFKLLNASWRSAAGLKTFERAAALPLVGSRRHWKALASFCGVAVAAFSFPKIEAAKKFDGSEGESTSGQGPLSRSAKFNFIADVVERASPAVVYIEIQARNPYSGEAATTSNGSGFIVKDDGLILTNAHVVANKTIVLVKLHDQRVFRGVVEDLDPISDLATIRIQCKNLPTLRLATSSKARPGEWVVAMGSPLSLTNTITAGVISAVHRGSRELGLSNHDIEYIQTDASITFGHSGGPLVNLDGEVVGINTMKITPGISFAIASDHAKKFLETSERSRQSRATGWFGLGQSTGPVHPPKRRYIGITMLTLTPDIIPELQQRKPDFPSDVRHGVLVWKVVVGSPAHQSGLLPGDVVTEVNGTKVNSAADVYNAIKSKESLKVSVVRKNEKRTLTIVPEDAN